MNSPLPKHLKGWLTEDSTIRIGNLALQGYVGSTLELRCTDLRLMLKLSVAPPPQFFKDAATSQFIGPALGKSMEKSVPFRAGRWKVILSPTFIFSYILSVVQSPRARILRYPEWAEGWPFVHWIHLDLPSFTARHIGWNKLRHQSSGDPGFASADPQPDVKPCKPNL